MLRMFVFTPLFTFISLVALTCAAWFGSLLHPYRRQFIVVTSGLLVGTGFYVQFSSTGIGLGWYYVGTIVYFGLLILGVSYVVSTALHLFLLECVSSYTSLSRKHRTKARACAEAAARYASSEAKQRFRSRGAHSAATLLEELETVATR
jgi:hypothetical protein